MSFVGVGLQFSIFNNSKFTSTFSSRDDNSYSLKMYKISITYLAQYSHFEKGKAIGLGYCLV